MYQLIFDETNIKPFSKEPSASFPIQSPESEIQPSQRPCVCFQNTELLYGYNVRLLLCLINLTGKWQMDTINKARN